MATPRKPRKSTSAAKTRTPRTGRPKKPKIAAKPAFSNAFTPEIARIILDRLSAGETLRAICKDLGSPTESSVRGWVLSDDDFAAQYTRAREVGYLSMADEIIDAARETNPAEKRTVKPDGSQEVVYLDAVDRSRLHVDSLKWALSKALPKVFGEKLEIDAKISKGKPMTDQEMLAEIAALSQEMGGKYQLVEIEDDDGNTE
jgi:hypothetical protein